MNQTEFKKLDKDRMTTVFFIVNELPIKRNYRYDILVDGINQYCLVLNHLLSEKQVVIIEYKNGEQFINDLLLLKSKSEHNKQKERNEN